MRIFGSISIVREMTPGLALLQHVEVVADHVIVTYQPEQEFEKNRQAAILEGMQELKAPSQIGRRGIFSDAQAANVMNRSLREAEKRVKFLKGRLTKALENPSQHDPVYQACQRIFHRNSSAVALAVACGGERSMRE